MAATVGEATSDLLAIGDPQVLLLPAARGAVAGCSAVNSARRLTGGANQETWAFSAETAQGPVPLILRRARGGTMQRATGIGLAAEAAVLRVAHAGGVAVPEVLYELRPEDGLGQGFVMRRVTGETIPRRIMTASEFAAVRPRLAGLCGAALASIHAVPTGALERLQQFTPLGRVEWLHERYRATGVVSPVVAYAFTWLRQNAPALRGAPALVHGDFRNGNLMIGPDGINAVLDWENAHLGDPAEDLGWLCVPSWRFGEIDQPAGGLGSREDLLAGYAASGGRVPAPERLRFWEAYGSLYWGVICARSLGEFRSGEDASVERAMIARRLSETELDLLRLIAPRS